MVAEALSLHRQPGGPAAQLSGHRYPGRARQSSQRGGRPVSILYYFQQILIVSKRVCKLHITFIHCNIIVKYYFKDNNNNDINVAEGSEIIHVEKKKGDFQMYALKEFAFRQCYIFINANFTLLSKYKFRKKFKLKILSSCSTLIK